MDNKTVANTTVPSLEELNEEERLIFLPVLVFYVIIMVVGLIGNAFVMAVYYNKMKEAKARWYILSLAALDFGVCFVGIPYHVLDLTFHFTYEFTYVCKTLSVLMGVLNYGSIFVLMVVAIDRYCVCHPFKRQVSDFGDKNACGIAVLVSVLVSWPNFFLYGNSSVETRIEGLYGVQCFFDNDYGQTMYPFLLQALTLVIFVACIVVLIVLYIFICRVVFGSSQSSTSSNNSNGFVCCGGNESDDEEECGETDEVAMETLAGSNKNKKSGPEILPDVKHEDNITAAAADGNGLTSGATGNGSSYKRLQEGNEDKGTKGTSKSKKKSEKKQTPIALVRHRAPGTSKKKDEKQRRKITLVMFSITVVFIVSYLPYLGMALADSLDDELWDNISLFKSVIFEICLRTYLFNNMANPIIYGFWDKKFRRECISLIRKLLCCQENKSANLGKSFTAASSRQTFTSCQTKSSVV